MQPRTIVILAGLALLAGISCQCSDNGTGPSPSPTWARTYGTTESDGGKCVLPTGDGGYVIAGWTRDTDSRKEDFYLLKVNASGDMIWESAFGGADVDYAWSIVDGPDAGFIVAGLSYSYGAGRTDAYVVRTDAAGQPVWDRTFGGWNSEEARSMAVAGDGGYVFAGYSKSFGAGLRDVYLVKIDVSGASVWETQFGGDSIDMAHGVSPTPDGGFIIVGETRSFGTGDRDIYLIKVDASGDSLWSRTFGGAEDDIGYAVTITSDGGYLIAGATKSSGAGDYDIIVLKTDAAGDSVWANVFGGSGYDHAVSIVSAADGGCLLAGYTNSFGAGGDDVYLVKTDESGHVIWEKTYGGVFDDRAAGVSTTGDDGYIVTGWTKSSGAGSADVYLIKIDKHGDL